MARVLKSSRYLSLKRKAGVYEDWTAGLSVKDLMKKYNTTHSTIQRTIALFMPFIDRENSAIIKKQSKINDNE